MCQVTHQHRGSYVEPETGCQGRAQHGCYAKEWQYAYHSTQRHRHSELVRRHALPEQVEHGAQQASSEKSGYKRERQNGE